MFLILTHAILTVLVPVGTAHPKPLLVTHSIHDIMETKPKRCFFESFDEELPVKLKEKLGISGVKLLRYNVTFVNYTNDVMVEAGGDLFRPYLWLRTVNRQGSNLLMFDDNFEVFSMGLLGVGIEDMDVQLTDNPRGCIHNLTSSERMSAMRQLLQVDFRVNKTDEKIDELDEHVCNMRVYVPGGVYSTGGTGARFTYVCCHNEHDVMTCADMEENNWVSTLIQILKTIIVFLILFSPKFVPSVYYKNFSLGGTDYTTVLPEACIVRVEKENGEYFLLKQDDMIPLDGMPKAKETLDGFASGISALFKCRISDITISVPRDQLLGENSLPVSISAMLYDNIFRCRVGNIAPFTSCCSSSLYGEVFEEQFEKYKIKWQDCLRVFMKIVIFCFCLLPSIIQYIVYDQYIAPGMRDKENALVRFNASYVYMSDFDILGLGNITLHFYAVFVVILTGIILEVYFHFISRFVPFPKFSTHFRDMENQEFLPILKSILHLTLVPFLKCGVFGVLVFPWYIVIVLLYTVHFLVIIFPLLNLIFRLLLYPFLPLLSIRRRRFLEYFGIKDFGEKVVSNFHKLDTISSSKRFLAAWYPYMAICCIFVAYLLVWVVDCVIFYTKVLFYTGIGIIANSDKTLPYVTVTILVGIYVSQIFGNVSKIYSDYLKTIRNVLLSVTKSQSSELTRETPNRATHIAFFSKDHQLTKFSDLASSIECGGAGEPVYFNSKELFIFLERTEEKDNFVSSRDSFYESFDDEVNDIYHVFTPQKLFFDSIGLDAAGSPGQVWVNILWACVRLVIVVIFLVFVVIVVMGLGDTYQISITNQLFLTVAGGLLPLIFRHVVSDSASTTATVDTENSDLRLNLIEKLHKYRENWELVDMSLSLVEVEREASWEDTVGDHDDVKDKEAKNNSNGFQDGDRLGTAKNIPMKELV